MQANSNERFFQSKVLGHPAGLFVLFFTEMWERFSFYGMRVLLINFLTMAIIGTNPGWEWDPMNAGSLFATYAGLLYLTPILGGVIADKYLGYRLSVTVGALIMALGHGCMALETEASLYLGLGLLVIGTGFFKPTMTSIISEMYKDLPKKKDGAYTIFYMGVNAGAFFGMMLCGYLAEKLGWSWGFGLAGIFMLLGLLQFWFAKPLFGTIGDRPSQRNIGVNETEKSEGNSEIIDESENTPTTEEPKRNPFTITDKILTVITSIIGLAFLLHDPFAINGMPLIPDELAIVSGGQIVIPAKLTLIIIGLILFLYLVISRILRYNKVLALRMVAFIIFAFFTIFFWMSFEQGASSLIIFARDYTDRFLDGSAANAYFIIDILLTFIPLIIITWVLIRLWIATSLEIKFSNVVLALSFLGVWGIAIWKVQRDMNTNSYQIEYLSKVSPELDSESGKQKFDKEGNLLWVYEPVTEDGKIVTGDTIVDATTTDSIVLHQSRPEIDEEHLAEYHDFKPGTAILTAFEKGAFRLVSEDKEKRIRTDLGKYTDRNSPIIQSKIVSIRDSNQVEITTSWFSILNSFFIIAFASFFSKLWESKYNPPPAVKYGLGLLIMAIGFGVLAFGSQGLGEGGEIVRVSLWWLVFAYLFHTLGELCLSPVGLSYVSKLVPARMIGFMFGMWYLAIAIGNYAAGYLGGMIESITEEYSMSTFFLIFTIVPGVAGIIVMLLHPLIKKLMGGVN